MDNLNKLASDIAMLSNDELARFALILSLHYPIRADKMLSELSYIKALTS